MPIATPDTPAPRGARIAYFSMEVGLDDALPIYSGGLGVLAGDYLRSAADLHLPLVAVSLLYRNGYFVQVLGADGRQSEAPVEWRPEDRAERLDAQVEIELAHRPVRIGVWKVDVKGGSGGTVPLYLLDTDMPLNLPEDRSITDTLYAGDRRHRLRQEAVLGIGGVRMLRALGYDDLATFHMNEGHSALLTLALLEETGDPAAVRERCVFTTHTPVPAGHDRFAGELVTAELGATRVARLLELGGGTDELDMTALALHSSRVSNGVSRRHREVAQEMHPDARLVAVTNGVHAGRWVGKPVRMVLDRHVPGWEADNCLLRCATSIPLPEVAAAHAEAKQTLLEEVALRTGTRLDPTAFTIGAARRMTRYKRTTMLFDDLDRLRRIAAGAGRLQVVCSGKSHPDDADGKSMLPELAAAAAELRGDVEVVLLANYDLQLAALLCAGCDVWLNVPTRPLEASGTSGMKAALNGVPSLSVVDGWWVEGWVEGVTGWAVGTEEPGTDDAGALYDKLEHVVLPLYYGDRDGYTRVRRSALALNGSYFNTERMARDYARLAYSTAGAI
jgi:starch phosphorylase